MNRDDLQTIRRWGMLLGLGVGGGVALVAVVGMLLAAAAGAAEPFHRPRWADVDHDGLDTRAEVLVSRCAVAELVKGHVRRAVCRDAYTGREVATDTAAQSLQVDHILPAVHAWRARTWTPSEFREFFNDPDNLAVTRSRTNEQKGDLLPHQWCPADVPARPAAAEVYLKAAIRYGIALSADEFRGLGFWIHRGCAPGAKVLGN